jgi:sugar phosphate isomerase/epimerase
MASYKIASGFAPFSPCGDRFNPPGYRDPMSLEEQMAAASRIRGLTGTGLDYPYQFKDPEPVRKMLAKYNLAFCTLEIGLYPDRKWGRGTYTSTDPAVRRDAIEMSKRALDVAADLGADDVLMWPGQDGFDYPFATDYQVSWKMMVDAIAEVAAHRPDVKIAIEYKKQEPRANIHIRNAGVLLSLLHDVGMKNVGGCIDLGHSLAAGENPGEAAVLLARAGKLFQVHVNDNYRDWDHDLILGSVSFWETLEFFYWLRRCGYGGWYVLDIYPYREEGSAALQTGVDRVAYYLDTVARIDTKEMTEILRGGDSVECQRAMWESVLGKGRGP